MKIVGVFFVCIMLSACAPNSVNSLKENSAASISLDINLNYQRVYKDVLDKMYECKGEGWAGAFAQFHIRHELDSEKGEAFITYVMSNAGDQNHYLRINIKQIDNEKTHLDAYVYFSTWQKSLEKIKGWATEQLKDCG